MPASDTEPSREGEHLAEKYLLGKRLGSGGMGEVYRAQNTLIGRTVAIKVLRREHAENKEVVGRFLREARAANIVRHPNVVDVLDIGQDASGTPFIVQELLEGEDLADRVNAAGGRLPVDEVIKLLVPVVEAVALGHAKGVIHRDLKPDNVFLARQGGHVVPKLLDFGISQIALAAGELRLTAASFSMGTPAYMSPEHIQGTALDAGTDVWAIGIMLHELVSGRLPFRGDTQAALFVQVCTVDAIPLLEAAPHAPPEFARIVERCLRREKSERYANGGALAIDLRVLADPNATSRPPSLFPPSPARAMGTAPTLVVQQKPKDEEPTEADEIAPPPSLNPPAPAPPPRPPPQHAPMPRVVPLAESDDLDNVLDPDLSSGISLNSPVYVPTPEPVAPRTRPLTGARAAEPKPALDPRISAGVVLFLALIAGAAASSAAFDALHLEDMIVSLRKISTAAPLAVGAILLVGSGTGIARAAGSVTGEMRTGHYSRLPGELAIAVVLGAVVFLAVRCLAT